MQLIYRWTKSLDPSLKKGFWAPEEDAVSGRPQKPRGAVPQDGSLAPAVPTKTD